jgi:transaldolase
MTAIAPKAKSLNSLPLNSIRLMLDSADSAEWEQWLPTGMLYGITTNPLLLQRSQIPCQIEALKSLAVRALSLGAQEIQLQAWGGAVAAYRETGAALAAVDPRVVVKIPIVAEGVTAAAELIRQGHRITLTGVYAVPQVLIAAALGAEYAAPSLGRIHDMGQHGCTEVSAMQRSLDGICSSTRLLVASIRRTEDIAILAAQGLNTFTISSAIMEQFFNVPATIEATEAFEQAAHF